MSPVPIHAADRIAGPLLQQAVARLSHNHVQLLRKDQEVTAARHVDGQAARSQSIERPA